MNLSDFRALIAEYALEHPNRELSSVTMIDFAAWLEAKRQIAKIRDFAAHYGMPSGFAERHGYAAKQVTYVARGSGCAHHARDVGEPCDVCGKVKAALAPEGSPRCDLCKDTGWRRSVERGRKVECECGALARGHGSR